VTIVSFDFSILYPGVCICRDFKSFKWIAGVNTKVRKIDDDHFSYINSSYPALKIVKTQSRRYKDEQYHVTERVKLVNYLEIIDLIVSEVKKEVANDQNIICCLEGISFGSSGNSLVDISQATGILKHQIVSQLLDNQIDRLFIFSPSELKNAIGCKGNANKHDILAKFKSDPILDSIKESDLYRLLHKEPWVITGDKVLSPIMDMVDSYLGVVKVHGLSK
jgi:Holliday junction resolvasome RuvABC endonuclease subunit